MIQTVPRSELAQRLVEAFRRYASNQGCWFVDYHGRESWSDEAMSHISFEGDIDPEGLVRIILAQTPEEAEAAIVAYVGEVIPDEPLDPEPTQMSTTVAYGTLDNADVIKFFEDLP